MFYLKKRSKGTDDTRQSHHKEHSLTDKCWHCILPWFVAFTVQDPGRGIVVTTGFKPKSKLPVNLGRLWTVGNIELDQTYISAHRFDT